MQLFVDRRSKRPHLTAEYASAALGNKIPSIPPSRSFRLSCRHVNQVKKTVARRSACRVVHGLPLPCARGTWFRLLETGQLAVAHVASHTHRVGWMGLTSICMLCSIALVAVSGAVAQIR